MINMIYLFGKTNPKMCTIVYTVIALFTLTSVVVKSCREAKNNKLKISKSTADESAVLFCFVFF